MEEASSPLYSTISYWTLKQAISQTCRNQQQLQNRLSILQKQKVKKAKHLQNMLEFHRRTIDVKLFKSQLKENLGNRSKDHFYDSQERSHLAHDLKNDSSSRIHERKQELHLEKRNQFLLIKQQRQLNAMKIGEQSLQDIKVKAEKRNRVKLMELESKENVNSFWAQRINSFNYRRAQTIAEKLRQHERDAVKLAELQNNEQNLLEELKKAKQIQEQLTNVIEYEKKMSGPELSAIYENPINSRLRQ